MDRRVFGGEPGGAPATVTGVTRYRTIVDVLAILVQDARVLLAERRGTGYADGYYNLPSGHLEAGESVAEAVIREAREEIGVDLDPAGLRCAHVMHYRSPEGQGRVGVFFEARDWRGEPRNHEPHKCARIGWFPLNQLPPNTVDYTRAGLQQYRQGTTFSLTGWPSPEHALLR